MQDNFYYKELKKKENLPRMEEFDIRRDRYGEDYDYKRNMWEKRYNRDIYEFDKNYRFGFFDRNVSDFYNYLLEKERFFRNRNEFNYPYKNLELLYDYNRNEIPFDIQNLNERRLTAGNTWENFGKRGWELPFYEGWWRPRADILDETGQNFRIEFELPGVPKENISLVIGEDYIILSSIKPQSKKEEKGYYYQNERHFGNFYRKLDLPGEVDTNHCSAILDHGVLIITIKKTEFGIGGERTTDGPKFQKGGKKRIEIKEIETKHSHE